MKCRLLLLGMVAAFTACSEPSAPAGAVEKASVPVRQITGIRLRGPDGQLYDNNNHGDIVGDLTDTFGSWHLGVFHRLPMPSGWDGVSGNAINESGAIVGRSVQLGRPFAHAILYRHSVLHDLGVLPGDAGSEARAINAWGDIVGVSMTSRDVEHAVLWHKGRIIALDHLAGDPASAAYGIDSLGRVMMSTSSGAPFVWRNGVMTELTALERPGVSFTFTRDEIAAWKCPYAPGDPKPPRRVGVIAWVPCPIEAADEVFPDIEDVNASGQAVGRVMRRLDLDRKESHGYLWSGGERILLLPSPDGSGTGSEPRAINDRGEIVGNSSLGPTLWRIQ